MSDKLVNVQISQAADKLRKLKNSTPQVARTILSFYLIVIFIGGVLLSLPISKTDGKFGEFFTALFTSVSGVCITGLSTVDVSTFWSPFGQFVILLLVKLGGLGILSLATLIGIVLSRRVGVRSQIIGATESSNLSAGDIRKTLGLIVLVSSVIEAIGATILTLRFWNLYGYDLGKSLWYGIFHSVSSFNNAGFALYPDSLTRFQNDPVILLTTSTSVIIGSLGFLALFEIGRRISGRVVNNLAGGVIESKLHWSLTTRIVLWASAALIVLGTFYVAAMEWNNYATLGHMSTGTKWLNAFAFSVYSRSAGLNSVDISQLDPITLLGTDILMFIGGGSGSTAGGIKVTTLTVLIFVVWTEIRGGTAVNIGNRRLPRSIQRQAITVVALALSVVLISTIWLHIISPFNTDFVLFEVISAFGTVGLSTGVTAGMPVAGQTLIMVLMFLGRLGTVLVATSLAARVTQIHYEYPKERPQIG